MKTADLWNRFIANTFNENKMNFSYNDFEKAINERIKTELRFIPVEEKLPQEQIVVIGKTDNLREPCACYYETSSSDFRLYPHGGFVRITHWRPIF